MVETATPLAHQDVWERARQGDSQEARRELVNIYARIVKYVAGRMAIGLPHYVEFNDLISAGLLGLIQAIDHFDHERGIKFETYAIPRIRGSILDELRSQDWFPRSLRRKAKQLEEAYATLEIELGRPATDAEVAARLEIDLEELDGLVGEVSIATIMSLDADTSGDEGESSTTLGDYLADVNAEDVEQILAKQEMKNLIGRRMSELPEKEQLVLVLYYYEELTLKEIGEILDVTESRPQGQDRTARGQDLHRTDHPHDPAAPAGNRAQRPDDGRPGGAGDGPGPRGRPRLIGRPGPTGGTTWTGSRTPRTSPARGPCSGPGARPWPSGPPWWPPGSIACARPDGPRSRPHSRPRPAKRPGPHPSRGSPPSVPHRRRSSSPGWPDWPTASTASPSCSPSWTPPPRGPERPPPPRLRRIPP